MVEYNEIFKNILYNTDIYGRIKFGPSLCNGPEPIFYMSDPDFTKYLNSTLSKTLTYMTNMSLVI
jgi:hypothetical protein